MGHVISSDGIHTDREKVRAITDFPQPTCLTQVRRFLGMVQYLSRYIPNLTDDLHTVQNLTKKDVPSVWSDSQEIAFLSIKEKIVGSPCLAIYDPSKGSNPGKRRLGIWSGFSLATRWQTSWFCVTDSY